MARLLFMENREKTVFWAGLARRLRGLGHDVSWVVQNPVFAGGLPGEVHIIPFPTARDMTLAVRLDDFPALATDRGREYFAAGYAHYAYYENAIRDLLALSRPDLVIGEPTLFHELLAVQLCRELAIPFAHPVAERYPPERFAIFDGDTQRALIESGDQLSEDEAIRMADMIADGRSIPTYMIRGGTLQRLARRSMWAATRTRVIAGRWRGERFNTPSISTKLRQDGRSRDNLSRWSSAATVPDNPERAILYPLQQQPENTIDVWGRPDFDQIDILRRILAVTPGDVTIAVKANPKPYYELSDRLLAFGTANPRIDLLPVGMTMVEAMKATTGAITITGTVGYEAVFGRGRCLSVSHPILDTDFPEFTASSVEAAAHRLLDDPRAGQGNPEAGARLLQRLVNRSFAGKVSDPVSDPACMDAENVDRVASALQMLINSWKPGIKA